ncbi:EcoRV family type II restriction endonuclease [Candidatus Albibeggiatoa sp. nov. NOAA]|uniref:EcoRV family type II restriction endonuclease n=1 Tax=Candidatus Albibeggiatoa sp. nov. NOAA TaxID=3162724 RepID=UPI0032FF9D05|nr:EcoRV family type II restriction endonuclease [Thiotrichaceae bacterium]
MMNNTETHKLQFANQLKNFVKEIQDDISTEDGQWTIKGFIDLYQNVYTISSDTKIISKILEIHLFPKILAFAQQHGYKLVLAEHQNYYPDISFVSQNDETLKFAVDFKTTYRNPKKAHLCNGFTLGSHGKYFEDRKSTKNIQFPYSTYAGHFCFGIIYSRTDNTSIDETNCYQVNELHSIVSVIKDFQFFIAEKWKIASDKSGSGNTANIGSINNIDDILQENGMFAKLGESWFDDYWMNYNKIIIPDKEGGTKKITSLRDFVEYRRGDVSKIVAKCNRALS